MRFFVCLMCVLLLVGGVFAQTNRGTITGTVKDPAGAVVPGANVLAKNTETSAEFSTVTTNTGNYTISELPIGNYSVTVSMTGFKTAIRQGLTVSTAQTVRIDMSLEVGSISESVTVSADAPLLKTESGELSHNVKSDTLNELPVLSIGGGAGVTGIRNPYAVMQMLPGADWTPDQNVRLNGAPGNSQALRVEGMDATNNMWQQRGQFVQQGVDAIQEFAVQTSNYAAEYGQAGAGLFNLTMKSGTNALHGSAYEYFVNEALNASSPYSNDGSGGKVRPRSRRNDFGFTLGGPIYLPKIYDGRDKSFFFFSFEQYRQNTTQATPQTVPTLAMRQGDFSAVKGTTPILDASGNPILDSKGRQVFENTIYDWRTGDPFPNNQLPPELWDESAVLVQAMFPKPINNQLVNNWINNAGNKTLTFIPSVKIDYSLSPKVKLSGYWSRNSYNSTANDGLPLDITAGVPDTFVSHTARFSVDYTVQPTMLLHIGVGLMHNTMHQLSPDGVDTAKTFKMTTQAKGFPYIAPFVTSMGGMGLGMGSVMNAQLQNIKPTANFSLSWIRGNHSYKFGGEMIIESHPSYSETFANNWYNFTPIQTSLPEFSGMNTLFGACAGLGGKCVGFPYASFLAGRNDWGFTNAPSRGHLGAHSFSFYVQDTWKITPKVTLDYGLRYDYQTYLKEQYGRWANWSPTEPNPTADGLPGATIFEGNFTPNHCQCDFADVYPYAFGPRLGLAYQIAPKTVLRVGAGFSYGRTGEVGYVNNVLSTMVMYGLFKAPASAANTLQGGPPENARVVWPDIRTGAFPKLPELNAPSVGISRGAGRPPRQFQWSFGIQREITKDLVVEASYVGNRGVWWQANGVSEPNGVTPEYLASKGIDFNSASDRALLNTPYLFLTPEQQAKWPLPFANFPIYNYPNLLQAIRPFPQHGNVPQFFSPLGNTWYDSLQVKVTKRYSHNFDLTYSFTFQKELTIGSELSYQIYGMIDPQVSDTFNRQSNKFISGLSRPFMNVLAASYTVPKVFGQNRFVSLLLRDWQISALLRYTSAQPISVPRATGQVNPLNTLLGRNANTLVNRVPGQSYFTVDDINGDYDPATTFVLNKNAWSTPDEGKWGTATAYYNDYRGRRHPTENMAIARNFRFGRDSQYNIQLRAEFNNIFNRLWVPNPTASNIGQSEIPGQGGFGYINMYSPEVAANVRSGQIVARFTF